MAQDIQGTTIHAALVRQYGFGGSYSAVKRLIRRIRAAEPPQVTSRLTFAPGEAAQVDFGAGPLLADPRTGELRKSWFFVMTLCWSRHQYAELVWDQKVMTWLACHRRAFNWFGGLPERIIIDNAKCAITKACINDPEVQRAYGEYAEGYGFRIDPCPPHDPQKKGIVESGVKYLKRSFLPLREFLHRDDAQRQLQEWVLGEAGNRIHGTTRQAPLNRFSEVEKALLQPLPENPPEISSGPAPRFIGMGISSMVVATIQSPSVGLVSSSGSVPPPAPYVSMPSRSWSPPIRVSSSPEALRRSTTICRPRPRPGRPGTSNGVCRWPKASAPIAMPWSTNSSPTGNNRWNSGSERGNGKLPRSSTSMATGTSG